MGKKRTKEEVADVVEMEGLGYAVQYYMGPENIEDDELAREWRAAKEALDNITDLLAEWMS